MDKSNHDVTLMFYFGFRFGGAAAVVDRNIRHDCSGREPSLSQTIMKRSENSCDFCRSHRRLTLNDLMEVSLVLIGVLTIVNGAELQDAQAAGGASRKRSRSALRDAGSSRVRSNSGLLRVGRRGSRSEREKSSSRDGSEGEELLRRLGSRHFECCFGG